jgi:hypothetical protein
MMLGDLPPQARQSQAISFEKPLRQADRKPLHSLTPIATAKLGADHFAFVIFEDGHLVKIKYFDLIRERWPLAKWYGDDGSRTNQGCPIVVRYAGELVALVMAVRPEGYQEDVDAILLECSRAPRGATAR